MEDLVGVVVVVVVVVGVVVVAYEMTSLQSRCSQEGNLGVVAAAAEEAAVEACTALAFVHVAFDLPSEASCWCSSCVESSSVASSEAACVIEEASLGCASSAAAAAAVVVVEVVVESSWELASSVERGKESSWVNLASDLASVVLASVVLA